MALRVDATVWAFEERLALCARNSQTPGPVVRQVFMPDRKSGMPALRDNSFIEYCMMHYHRADETMV